MLYSWLHMSEILNLKKRVRAAELGLKQRLGRQLGQGQLGLLSYLLLPGCHEWCGRVVNKKERRERERERKEKETLYDIFYKHTYFLIEHMLQVLISPLLSVLTLLKTMNKEIA